MKKRLLTFAAILSLLLCQSLVFARHKANNDFNNASPATLNNCEKTDQCFVFSYKGYKISTDGQEVILSFSIKTNCNRDLSYAAFGLPAGAGATASGKSKYKYKTSITNNPFYAIKYEGVGIAGYKNGTSDDFSYTISKTAFDKLTTIQVQAKAATIVGKVSFDKTCGQPECTVSDAALSKISYTVNGVSYTVLDKAVKQGKPVKVCFTVVAAKSSRTYSFVSYKAPLPDFNRELADKQVLFDYKTIVVGPAGGTFCMEIAVPACYYQVDFVKGCIIEKLGPASSNNFYGSQGRLVASGTGGTVSCTPDEKTGNQGCTPGYWKQDQHFGNWAPAVPTGIKATRFFDVFTVCDQNGNGCTYQGLPASLTLLEALKLNGGGFYALARHATAAYLNAISTDVAYSIKRTDIITNVVNAFKTGNSGYKATLEAANQKDCPLGRSEFATTSSIATSERNAVLSVDGSRTFAAAPNPFNGKTTISFALNKSGQYTIGLLDLQGKLVRQLRSGFGKAGELQQINLEASSLSKGMYFVQLIANGETKTIKLFLRD